MRNLFNIAAEHDVIGTVAAFPDRLEEVSDLLPDHFYDRQNRAYWEALVAHIESGAQHCIVTPAEKAGVELGYIEPIVRAAQRVTNLEWRVKVIKQHYQERQLFETATRIQDELLSDDNQLDALDKAEAVASELEAAADDQEETGLVDMRECVREYVEFLEWRHDNPGVHGITTGLKELDARYQGWKGGELWILAARPGMGKTTLAMAIAAHTGVDHGGNTLVFSLEMPRKQLTQRLFASIGHLPLKGLKDASVLDSAEHGQKIQIAAHKLIKSGLKVDDTGGLDIADLRRRARKEHRRKKVDLIIVDYLQLLNDRTEKDRFQVISAISRKLKSLAKELDCVVLALSQLSRSVEQRQDKRPINSDLRESGQIEQDADGIIFIYRDEVYDEDSHHKGIAELITGKMRDGEVGTDFAAFIGAENRFADLTFRPESEQSQRQAASEFSY